MKSFFKIFIASLLALIVFTILGVMVLIGLAASASSSDKPLIGSDAVLVLDLSKPYKETVQENPFASLTTDGDFEIPSLFEMVRLIEHAKKDANVKGIYILASSNANGFAASEEIRKALLDFRKSKKFVVAYGETITQKGYSVANVAQKIFVHPQGGLEWAGFSSNLLFLKGMLDKLEIKPQIFYAGKFKSATEPLRETQMTDANRLQTSVWLGDLYNQFLYQTAAARNLDTALIRSLAVEGKIQTAADAVKYNLIDGLKYDDQVKNEITGRLNLATNSKINVIYFGEYAKSVTLNESTASEKIAIIYASGDIISGTGTDEQVASDDYKELIRKARLDKSIKAIVLRVNSPGGSALASDVIWREVSLAKKEKPVIVSMGDVAASGGYYIACNANKVFANASTITGSIGVFSIVPNIESFLKNKIGITTDRVRTGPFADMGSMDRALTEPEKKFFQASTDSIYNTFKSRVSEGRKRNMEYVDSIAQGRVWTGTRGMSVGLVDEIGTLSDAIKAAASMAKITTYRLKEYPEKKNILEQLFNNYKRTVSMRLIESELGADQLRMMQQVKKVKAMVGVPQTALPYTITVH
ncbi:MAG: signal peptide peptidase SppA [Bacteroidota bacterium]|jgi:protease-4